MRSMNPVELHMVSDSTGETAQRLVQALEAQFPDQEFLEIRHPRVETVADLQLAVERMKGRAAVIIYTLVEPELRDVDADDELYALYDWRVPVVVADGRVVAEGRIDADEMRRALIRP